MTRLPLDRISLHRRAHRSALWYLALLYRRPAEFRKALESLPRGRAAVVAVSLYLHALPYVVAILILGRLAIIGFADATVYAGPPGTALIVAFDSDAVFPIVWGIFYGIVFAIAGDIAGGIAFAIAFGIAFGIVNGIFGGIAGGIAFAIAFAIVGGIFGGIVYGIVYGIAFAIVGGIAFAIAVGMVLLRAYYLLPHPFFVWPRARGRWYPYHPVAWDDLCSVPFPGLHRLLVAYVEVAPEAANTEIERLISAYPRQRMAGLRARAILIARQAAGERDLSRLDGIVARLPEGERGFLAQIPRLRELVGEICRQQRRLDTVERPVFREPVAALLTERIENFCHQIAGFPEPLASEFRAAAEHWREIAERQQREARAIVAKEPTPQVFRAGDPVDRRQEAFVPRDRVIGELERQVMLATGCPGLLVYGRRRMGKSTLLRNLSGFLPDAVRVLVISLQDPRAFTALPSLLGFTIQTIRNALPAAPAVHSPSPGLSEFFDFLCTCNDLLEPTGERLILAFDEYNQIDEKIGAGNFTKDLLATVRESIQSHRRLTWVFAGSHATASTSCPTFPGRPTS